MSTIIVLSLLINANTKQTVKFTYSFEILSKRSETYEYNYCLILKGNEKNQNPLSKTFVKKTKIRKKYILELWIVLIQNN